MKTAAFIFLLAFGVGCSRSTDYRITKMEGTQVEFQWGRVLVLVDAAPIMSSPRYTLTADQTSPAVTCDLHPGDTFPIVRTEQWEQGQVFIERCRGTNAVIVERGFLSISEQEVNQAYHAED